MKEVFVLIMYRGYEDFDIIGVYSTVRKAVNAYKKNYIGEYTKWNQRPNKELKSLLNANGPYIHKQSLL